MVSHVFSGGVAVNVGDRLPGETAKMFALREITDSIINLSLKPGTLVSENELARVLGISRTPVREALQELQKSKLIVVYPQRGSYVAPISFDIIEEAAFLRRVLESAIVEELCDTITEEQVVKLDEIIRLQEYYLETSNPDKIFELDNEFHYTMFCMSNKDGIYNLMRSMMGHFDRMRTLTLYTVKDIKIVADHRAILDAIKLHDKENARALIIKHLLRYRLDKDEVETMYPQYFSDK